MSCWVAGLLGCWIVGLVGCWGVAVCCVVAVVSFLACWAAGLLTVGLLGAVGRWVVRLLGFWVVVCASAGVLSIWLPRVQC